MTSRPHTEHTAWRLALQQTRREQRKLEALINADSQIERRSRPSCGGQTAKHRSLQCVRDPSTQHRVRTWLVAPLNALTLQLHLQGRFLTARETGGERFSVLPRAHASSPRTLLFFATPSEGFCVALLMLGESVLSCCTTTYASLNFDNDTTDFLGATSLDARSPSFSSSQKSVAAVRAGCVFSSRPALASALKSSQRRLVSLCFSTA